MKKKKKIILRIVLVIILIWLIIFYIDFIRFKINKTPIFCVVGKSYQDGGSSEYIGLGYKIIVFKKISGFHGMKFGSWRMNFFEEYDKIYYPDGKDGKKEFEEYIFKIAKTYCEANIDDFEQYTCIEKKYMETANSYNMLFQKGNNILFIAITHNREVTAFTTLNQEELNQYKNIEIDNVKVNDFISNELSKKYGINFKDFKEKERKLKIIDGKFVLECSVETELKDGKPFFRDDVLQYMIGE